MNAASERADVTVGLASEDDRHDESVARRVVVALGLNAFDPGKLRAAETQARALGAELTLLHVLPPAADDGHAEARARTYLGALARKLREAGVSAQPVIRRGPVARTILAELRREGTELAVLGSHARRTLGGTALAGVANQVVREAPAPVLLVQPPAGPLAPADASDSAA